MTSGLSIMNILDYSPPFYGGVGAHLDALGDELHERGGRLHLAFPRTRGWFEQAAGHASTIRAMPSICRPIQNGFATALSDLARREHADVIHLHFSYALPLAIALQRPLRVPILYHWHNPPRVLLPLTPGSGSRLRRSLLLATLDHLRGRTMRLTSRVLARIGDAQISRHVVISREIETFLVQSRWTRPEKIFRLPNGLPAVPEEPAEWRERPRPFVVGSIANFREQKDHPTLLRAIARCIADVPELRLDLVGDGPTRPRIQDLARELGIASRIRFLGYVDNPSKTYRRMDAFVLSTHYEGQGLVILEAMAQGLPVIATDLPSIREALSDGDRGLLVPPGDPDALAASILKVVRDPCLRRSLSARSRVAALAAGGPRQWARTLADLYESVVVN